MAKVQLNFRVEEETRARIEDLARETHRGLGDVVDWLVDKEHRRMLPPVETQNSMPEAETGILSQS